MPLLGSLTAIGAAGSIYGGVSGLLASSREATLQREQGDIAVQEARVNAANEAWNLTQIVQKQRVAYLANGVSLEGSPALVLATSKTYAQEQVDSILRQGTARAKLMYGEAQNTENKGRAALIGGITQAFGGLSKAGAAAYQSGMFDPTKTMSTGLVPGNTGMPGFDWGR